MLDVFLFSLLTTSLLSAVSTQPEMFLFTVTPTTGDSLESIEVYADSIDVQEDGWRILGSTNQSIHFDDGDVVVEKPGQEPVRMEEARIQLRVAPVLKIKALLWVIYCTLFLSLFGSTPGKIALSLRVVEPSRPSPRLPVMKALLRSAFFLISFVPLGLGCLWSLTNRQRRSWHDSVSKTRVVVSPRG